MKVLLITLNFILINIFTTQAQEFSSIIPPSHESKIIMMGLHQNTLYTLDSNALLRITNTNTLQSNFLIPIRKKINHAFFSYPYIALIDTNRTMHIYKIDNEYIVFTATFQKVDRGAIVFSEDLSLFAFTSDTSLEVYNTSSWSRINQYDSTDSYSQFLFISKSNQNLMSYFVNGQISYYSIQSSSLIKSATSELTIHSISLNSNLRYAIGHTSNALNSIDMINGNSVDSILFNEQVLDLFASIEVQSDNILINTLSQQNNGSQYIRAFALLEDGSIQENDLLTITLPKISTSGISDNTNLYIGFNDGEVWRYPLDSTNIKHEVIIEDNTLAVYDAVYWNNKILLASIDGIYTVPLSVPKNNFAITNIQFPSLASKLQPYQFNNPSFILPRNFATDTMFVLSSNVPYSHIIAESQFSPQEQKLNNDILTDISFKPIAESPTLLYSLDIDSALAIAPHSINSNITNVYSDTEYTISYSAIDSRIYIYSKNVDIQVPLFSSRFIFQASRSTKNNEFILWTNTPLIYQDQESNIIANTIYSYRIENNTLRPLFIPYTLPFETEILHFSVISSHPSTLLISNTNKDSNTHTILHVTMPEQGYPSNNTNRVPNLFPKKIVALSEIAKEKILKIITLENKKTTSILFTDKNIRLISLNNNDSTIEFEYKIPYPKECGLFFNATLTPVTLNKNRESNPHIISVIDKNNTICTFLLSQKAIMPLTSFNVYNNNEIRYFTK